MLFLFCSSLVCFVCVCFCLCLFLSVSYVIHLFAILVFWFNVHSNLCFSLRFLVLCFLFLFCLVYVSDVPLCVFVFLLFCFVLNHKIRFVCFASSYLVVVFRFDILFLLIFGYLSKTSPQRLELANTKNQICRKTDILTRAVSTGVFTNSVFSFFVCLYTLHF